MSVSNKPPDRTGKPLTDRQAYNLVTDTVAGPNVRFKDNLYQGITVLVCALVGAPAGYALAAPTKVGGWIGAGMGAAAGMVVGVVASGAFLMVYRAIRHARGRHD